MKSFCGIGVLIYIIFLLNGSVESCGITHSGNRFSVHSDELLSIDLALHGDDFNGDGSCYGVIDILEDEEGMVSLEENKRLLTRKWGPECGSGAQIFVSPSLGLEEEEYRFIVRSTCTDDPIGGVGSLAIQVGFIVSVQSYVTIGLVAETIDRSTTSIRLTWPQLSSGIYGLAEYRIYRGSGPMDLRSVRNGDGELIASYSSSTFSAIVTGGQERVYDFFLVVGVTDKGRLVARSDSVRLRDPQNHFPRIVVRRSTCGEGTTVLLSALDSWDPDGDTLTFLWEVKNQPEGIQAQLLAPTSPETFARLQNEGTYEFQVTVRDPYDGVSQSGVWIQNQSANPSCWCRQSVPLEAFCDRWVPADVDYRTGNDDLLCFKWFPDEGWPDYPYHKLSVYSFNGLSLSLQEAHLITMEPFLSESHHLVVGDINGDGLADLAILEGIHHRVRVFRSTLMDAVLDSPLRRLIELVYDSGEKRLQENMYGIAVHDLDDDGDRDILLTTTGNSAFPRPNAIIYEHLSNFNFQVHSFRVFDEDKRIDLSITAFGRFFSPDLHAPLEIAIGPGDGQLRVFEWSAKEELAMLYGTIHLPEGTRSLSVFSTNNDYYSDIIAYTDKNVYLIASDHGKYSSPILLYSGDGLIEPIATIDVNGDAWEDVVFAINRAEIVILLSDGDGQGMFKLGECLSIPVTSGGRLYIVDSLTDLKPTVFLPQVRDGQPGLSVSMSWLRLPSNELGCRIVPEVPLYGIAPYEFSVSSAVYSAEGRNISLEWKLIETGNRISGERAVFRLSCPGIYTVELYARNDDGESCIDRVWVRVKPGEVLDCNANGILDICDIEKGISTDITNDGIPDECQNPPVSVPGGPYIVDCQGTLTNISVDGSKSWDPDSNNSLTFNWSTDCPGTFDDPTSPNPRLAIDTSTLPLQCTLQLKVSDPFGLSDIENAAVIVLDTMPPEITCPSDFTIECGNHEGCPVEYPTPEVKDLCDSSPVVTCDPTSGFLFPIGKTEVTCRATDDSGNMSTCTFKVTMILEGKRLPSDCNDDGQFDISDGICVLEYLFLGEILRRPCEDGIGNITWLDSNGDGGLDISDAVRLFSYLFLGEDPPAFGVICRKFRDCSDSKRCER